MTKPVDAARAVASALGLDFASVRQRARVLRDAGAIFPDRAGRGAGSLTSEDVARLLIASAIGGPIKDSAVAATAHESDVAKIVERIRSRASDREPYLLQTRISPTLTRMTLIDSSATKGLAALFAP